MNNLINKDELKMLIRHEIKLCAHDSSRDIEENLRRIVNACPDKGLIDSIMAEISRDQEEEIGETVSSQKKRREESLRELFSKIPGSCLDSICATAEVFNSNMLGGVYFIKNEYNNMIKIGRTNNIKERFAELKGSFLHVGMEPKLQLISIVLTFPKYMGQMESYFHQRFKGKRRIGEWFDITKEDIFNEILPCTDQFEFINDVLIDYTEYEYQYFKKVTKDYTMNDFEIKEMLGIKENHSPLDFLGRKYNKLSETLKSIEKNQVGFYNLYFSPEDEGCRKAGIKHTESDAAFDFKGLKRHKFSNTDWASVINSINPVCH